MEIFKPNQTSASFLVKYALEKISVGTKGL